MSNAAAEVDLDANRNANSNPDTNHKPDHIPNSNPNPTHNIQSIIYVIFISILHFNISILYFAFYCWRPLVNNVLVEHTARVTDNKLIELQIWNLTGLSAAFAVPITIYTMRLSLLFCYRKNSGKDYRIGPPP